MSLCKNLRIAVLATGMAVAAGAQTTGTNQHATGLPDDAAREAVRNDEVNRALSGNTPETNSTMQRSTDGDQGFDLGWLGLLGLAGLFGLGRGSRNRVDHVHDTHSHTHRNDMHETSGTYRS
jgi:hypothetical protein